MLAFQPDAPNERLHVDPALPEWLPGLLVCDIRRIGLIRPGGLGRASSYFKRRSGPQPSR